jgi:two-component sensor histidine kinase
MRMPAMRLESWFRKLPRDRPLVGLMAGGAFFVLASFLRWVLGGMSEGFGPMTFLPAILLAGLFGGIRIGLAVAALCTLVAWVMFFPPYGTFTLDNAQRITMVVFVFTAALELYVIRTLNLAIHELSESRERANTLFRELQHRVANNLQFVASFLWLRRKSLPAGSPGAEALDAARARLDMMSRVHRRLHDPSSVDQPIGDYLRSLCTDLIQASDTPDVRLIVQADPAILSLEALMSVSLIVAELVTNSLKHAFKGRRDGEISIGMTLDGEMYTVTVGDDGPGIPDNVATTNSGRLGRGILDSLARQLGGQIFYERGSGARVRLIFLA